MKTGTSCHLRNGQQCKVTCVQNPFTLFLSEGHWRLSFLMDSLWQSSCSWLCQSASEIDKWATQQWPLGWGGWEKSPAKKTFMADTQSAQSQGQAEEETATSHIKETSVGSESHLADCVISMCRAQSLLSGRDSHSTPSTILVFYSFVSSKLTTNLWVHMVTDFLIVAVTSSHWLTALKQDKSII